MIISETVLEIQSHYSTYAIASSYFDCYSLVSRYHAQMYLYRNYERPDLASRFVELLVMDIVNLDSTLEAELLLAVYLRRSIPSWKGILDSGVEMAHAEDIAMSRAAEVAEAG